MTKYALPLLILVGCNARTQDHPQALPAPLPEAKRTPGSVSSVEACPNDVSKLPAVDWLDRDDPRLLDENLRVVVKSRRRIMAFSKGTRQTGQRRTGCYRVALGLFNPTGTKSVEGDGRTPEGWYRSSDKPSSRFYGAIAIHYPNQEDAKRGLAEGRISRRENNQILSALRSGRKPPQNSPLGGEILIHGGGSRTDWTLGCIALDNADLDALRAEGPPSQAGWVLILP